MRIRHHHGFGHGLRPGEDRDLNCTSCKSEREAGTEPIITGSDDRTPGPDERRQPLHDLINEVEEKAREVRLLSAGRLSLAVVDNNGVTLREREGMGWHAAHLAADRALAESGVRV
jgi:hypothetical protein